MAWSAIRMWLRSKRNAAPVNASNFADDVNVKGVINNTDVSVTKPQVADTSGNAVSHDL